MKLYINNLFCCFLTFFIITCNDSVPKFDQESAYQFLLDQCDFGPINPGSIGYDNCKKFLVNTLILIWIRCLCSPSSWMV